MKKLTSLFIAIFAIMFALSSCSKDDPTIGSTPNKNEQVIPIITISQNEFTLSSDAQKLEIDVQSNTDYTVNTSVDWIKQVGTLGLSSQKITFDMEENTGGERKATIVLKSGDIQKSIVVVQEAKMDGIPYITFTAEDEQVLELRIYMHKLKVYNTGVDQFFGSMEYSVGDGDWKSIKDDISFGGSLGELRLRNINEQGTSLVSPRLVASAECLHIAFRHPNIPVACYGDIRTLVDYENYRDADTSKAVFGYLFDGCANLVSAPELPATTLEESCYKEMFQNCSSLTKAPELPATTLVRYCYLGMFWGCSSLMEAPELPATTLATQCYASMFKGCSNLTEAPELPTTTLGHGCYDSMFENCTGLTKAPKLPATTVYESSYYGMFRGCSSLTEAPELPATTLWSYCYRHMFENCSSLTMAPVLTAATTMSYCFDNMFTNCKNLEYLKIMYADVQQCPKLDELFNLDPGYSFPDNLTIVVIDKDVYDSFESKKKPSWTIKLENE